MVISLKNNDYRDFPGSPMAKTLRFHCRECGFNPSLGKEHPTCGAVWPKCNKNYFFNVPADLTPGEML